jgi:hypothetical protein
MEDLQDKIIELMDLFDGEVTTLDKINPPEPRKDVQDIEAINRFMRDNPPGMAGGGMLVQPSADGSRPGYSMSKKEKAAYMREYYAANKKLSEPGKLAAERDIKLRNFIGKKKTVKASELRPFLEGLGYEKVDYTKIRKKFPNLKIIKDIQTGNPKGTTTKYDKKALNVANRYANLLHKRKPNDRHYVNASKYMDLDDKGKKKIQDIMTRNKNKFNKDFSGGLRFDEKKEKILMDTFGLTENDFIKHGKYGVVQTIDGKRNPKYTSIYNFIQRGFKGKKVKSSEIISVAKQNKIKDNFELPEGQEWNFKSKNNPDGFKYGVSGAKSKNAGLAKRIERFLTEKKSYTLAADNSTTKGWMMNSMNRLYENEIKNKVKFNDLTYQPIKNEKGTIIAFKDNTTAGGGNTYYGLNKNTPEDATPWTAHGDFNRVDKFLDIAKGAQVDEPGKLLKQILDDKGITKLMGDKSTLTLNDVLSHERFFKTLSKTAPSELIRRQIVLHHTKAVGGDLAQAAATKDIQLLTQANNLRVREFENIVKGTKNNPARNLNVDEIEELKKIGAKITNLDGKVVGGGSLVAETQFANIEKGAIDYAKSDQFNVKTVASYLERLGCGKAAGGRVFYNEGAMGLTKCAKRGQLKLENIVTKGASNADDAVLAKTILKAGGGLKSAFALRNIFGPAAIAATVAFEGGLIGYDMLTSGKTLREAFGDNLLNYALGKDYQIDPQEELFKRFKGLGYDDQQIGGIKKALDAMNTINTGAQLAMDVGQQQEALQKSRGQPEPFMGPDDQMMADTAGQRAEQNLKDARNKLAEFNRDFQRSGQADELSRYIESGDYAKGFDLFEQAQKEADIQKLESAGPKFMGSVFPQFEKGRQEDLANLRSVINPAFNIPGMREATGGYLYGFANGGITNLVKEEREGYKLGKGVKIKPSKVRSDAKSIIDENIKLMKQMKETGEIDEISSDLNQVIKKALDEDLFDKKDRIVDTLNAKIARERKNFPYNQQVFEEPSQLDFYDAITKSNFRTKTGPFFDYQKRKNKAGGGLLKQAGDRSGAPPKSGPNPQGLQGLMKRGIKT